MKFNQGAMKDKKEINAGVTTSKVKFCDMRCEFAHFPEVNDIDGSRSCHTYLAIWCSKLEEYVTKNSPCAVLFGKRRPKTNW